MAVTFVSQYDLEFFTKIEADLNLKMQELENFKRENTKGLINEVTEAQRLATVDVKENLVDKKGKNGGAIESEAVQALRSMDYENKRVA